MALDSLRLVIVDDQKLFRENLKTAIELCLPHAEVSGMACNGVEALEMIHVMHPDLVLLDMRMPVMDGVECIRRLREEGDNVRVLVLTTFDDDDYVFEALRHGAAGYLLKDIGAEELAEAILKVHAGGTLLSPQVTAKLVAEATRNRYISPVDALARLTQRELDVLRQMALGLDNHEIARRLQLAEGTVKNHVSNIYEKLDLKNRAQAVRYVLLHHII